jgi:hypothetical protein
MRDVAVHTYVTKSGESQIDEFTQATRSKLRETHEESSALGFALMPDMYLMPAVKVCNATGNVQRRVSSTPRKVHDSGHSTEQTLDELGKHVRGEAMRHPQILRSELSVIGGEQFYDGWHIIQGY